jgi:ABC-type sugar transport system permease subunit
VEPVSGRWNIAASIRRSEKTAYLFVLPYVVYFLAFVAYPLTFSLVLMFHRWNIVTPMEWIGLKNFIRMFQDPLVMRSFLNTFIFLAIHIPLQIVVALGFAMLLNSPVRFRSFFRAVYFTPVVVSGVVVTILWQQMYSFDNGVFNAILGSAGINKIPWLVDPAVAMPSIAVMATWKNVGIYIVLFLVGLQHIPAELYEAAEIDGGSKSNAFWHVTVPMLNPTIIGVIVLSTIGGFSLFIEPYVLTGGGPMQSTLSAMLYIYNQAFYFGHMGYAATLGIVFALVILVVVVLQRKIIETES